MSGLTESSFDLRIDGWVFYCSWNLSKYHEIPIKRIKEYRNAKKTKYYSDIMFRNIYYINIKPANQLRLLITLHNLRNRRPWLSSRWSGLAHFAAQRWAKRGIIQSLAEKHHVATLLMMLLLPGWPTMGLNRIRKKKNLRNKNNWLLNF